MLCYRCGSHAPDGSEACQTCGQKFAAGIKTGAPIEGSLAGGPAKRRLSVAAPEGAPFKAGEVVANRYELRDILGVGPIGIVYRALDREIDVEVALKAIPPRLLQTAEERKGFAREMRAAKKLSHANVARVYDEGLDGDRAYVTEQLLEGLTLRRIIDLRQGKRQLFGLREVEPIFNQLAAALDYCHETGPHGDLKPDNVVILPDLLKVTDWGLCASLPRSPFVSAQRARKADRYLAPELVAGEPIDARADIYALGVILGEMLGGVLPDGEEIPGLVAVNAEVPPEVEGIYRRALAHNSAARYPRASDLAAELSAAAARLPEAPRPEPRRPPGPSAVAAARPAAGKPPPPPREALESGEIFLESSAIQLVAEGDPKLVQQAKPTEVLELPAEPSTDAQEIRTNPLPPTPEEKAARAAAVAQPGFGKRSPSFGRAAKTPQRSPAVYGAAAAAALVVCALGAYALLKKPASQERPKDAPVAAKAPEPVARPPAPVPPPRPTVAEVKPHEPAAQPLPPALVKPEPAPHHEKRAEKKQEKVASVSPDLPATPPFPAPVRGCPEGMVPVPGGPASIGITAEDPLRNFGDRDLHRVNVAGFCIDVFEYPNKLRAVPLTRVSYGQAERMCREQHKRLCTEDEWEKACKGPAGLRFPYGTDYDDKACNTQDPNGNDRPLAAAGSFERCKSGYGAYDLSGNAAEWTSTRFAPGAPDRTRKGGAANRPDFDDRCGARGNESPGARKDMLGFRCCAEAR